MEFTRKKFHPQQTEVEIEEKINKLRNSEKEKQQVNDIFCRVSDLLSRFILLIFLLRLVAALARATRGKVQKVAARTIPVGM